MLAHRGGASVIVGVGLHATLEEFLDRQRSGLASTFLTRLSVGPTLVDAASLPELYSGRVRPRHLLAVGVAGLVAVAAAVGPLLSGNTGRRPRLRGAFGRRRRLWRVAMMRRPLLVVLAMVFAVAAGIALGAGPLSTARSPEVAASVLEEPAPQPVPADPRAAYADALAATVYPRLYDGDELAGRSVLWSDAGCARRRGGRAGRPARSHRRRLVSQYSITDDSSIRRRSPVDTLGSQLAEQLSETTVPADATAYDRVGALLGACRDRREEGRGPAADAATIEQSLSSAGLLEVLQGASLRAPIVLVYLGEDAGARRPWPARAGRRPRRDGPVGRRGRHGRGRGRRWTARQVPRRRPGPGRHHRRRRRRLCRAVTAALATARSFTDVGGDFGAAGADGPVPMG